VLASVFVLLCFIVFVLCSFASQWRPRPLDHSILCTLGSGGSRDRVSNVSSQVKGVVDVKLMLINVTYTV